MLSLLDNTMEGFFCELNGRKKGKIFIACQKTLTVIITVRRKSIFGKLIFMYDGKSSSQTEAWDNPCFSKPFCWRSEHALGKQGKVQKTWDGLK